MQSTNNIIFMFVEPDINKFPDPENSVSEHILCVDFKESVNIIYMTKKDKPVRSL